MNILNLKDKIGFEYIINLDLIAFVRIDKTDFTFYSAGSSNLSVAQLDEESIQKIKQFFKSK